MHSRLEDECLGEDPARLAPGESTPPAWFDAPPPPVCSNGLPEYAETQRVLFHLLIEILTPRAQSLTPYDFISSWSLPFSKYSHTRSQDFNPLDLEGTQ